MITNSINLINYISDNNSNKGIDKKSLVNNDNSTESFKDVLDKKATKSIDNTEGAKKEEKSQISNNKDKNTIGELEEKFNKLSEAIENGDEEEINKAVEEVLYFLNINLFDEKQPLVEILESSTIDEMLSLGDYTINNSYMNINGISESTYINTLDINTSEVLSELEGNFDNMLSLLLQELGDDLPEDTIRSIENGIENLLAQLNIEDDNTVIKESLIESIKNLINKSQVSYEGSITATVDNDDTTVIASEDLDEASIIQVDEKDVVVETDSENSSTFNENSNDENNINDMSEDDKLLNSFIKGNESNFNAAISRVEARASVMQQGVNTPVTVYKANMDKDIITNVKFMLKNSMQELTVKIFPKELGEMTIKLISEEGIMRAEIKSISKETYNLLNSNINEIKKALSTEEIKIQDLNLSLYSEDTTYYSGQGFRENTGNSHGEGLQYSKENSTVNLEDDEKLIEEDQGQLDLLI